MGEGRDEQCPKCDEPIDRFVGVCLACGWDRWGEMYVGTVGDANKRPICENEGCHRKATLIFENWPDRLARRFCQPCHGAWRRGVSSNYHQGVPKPSRIDAGDDQ